MIAGNKNTRNGSYNHDSTTTLCVLWLVAMIVSFGMFFVGRMSFESDVCGRCYKNYCDQNRYEHADRMLMIDYAGMENAATN